MAPAFASTGAGPAAEMNSPSVEASGRWAALLIRLGSRSRHRRDSAMSQREFPSRAALTALVQGAVKLNQDGVLARIPVPVKPYEACFSRVLSSHCSRTLRASVV